MSEPAAVALLLTGRVVTPRGVVPDGAVVVDGERVAFAGRAPDVPVHWRHARSPHGWLRDVTLLPGLVDGHCHGGGGAEFGPDAVAAAKAVAHHRGQGTTSLVASLVSATPAQLVAGVAAGSALVAAGELAAVHVEGPFLSPQQCGAQNPAALRDVDFALVDDLAAAAERAGAPDAVAHLTFAPEVPGAASLPAALARHQILSAIGHTAADARTTRAALDAARNVAPRGGRPLVTHLFNGMPSLHHRAPGPVAAGLAAAARGDAVLEVIADGVHLAAETVRMLFDVVGPDSVCLVTDAMAASGMPDGRYALGGQAVIVADGTARLVRDGALAGGLATLLQVVQWTVEVAGVPLADAVTAASRTPARALALADVGQLEAGHYADVVVVDDALTCRAVLRRGQWVP